MVNTAGIVQNMTLSNEKLIVLPLKGIKKGFYIVRIHNFTTQSISTQKMLRF